MTLETTTPVAAKWLWDTYGKNFVDKVTNQFKELWESFQWEDAEAKYRARIKEIYGTTRLLGNPKPIIIEDIFTDIHILDAISAFQRYELSELMERPFGHGALNLSDESKPALRQVLMQNRAYILGKPGAGKSTFLKYIALQACLGKIQKTPIFVSLKEWADGELELQQFLVKQFDICGFPDAQTFIKHLLETGNALVLFDGLDEVNQEGAKRTRMIRTLTDFAKIYNKTQIFLTCRVAAVDYSFDHFTYFEIADFNQAQMRLFAKKWYQGNQIKLGRFLNEFEKPENIGLRELAQTPLLLVLICLAFDETLSFPARRVDLYREAFEALLKKWDASRDIRRDEIYRKLSPIRREQMLARLAADSFERGEYFIHREILVSQITNYLRQLPTVNLEDDIDGEAVLKAIESQHGILVERAYLIYSFSHLTFQEYLTARNIVENSADGTVERLIHTHSTDNRWREVFLITASLLDNADTFFEIFLDVLNKSITAKPGGRAFLEWFATQRTKLDKPKVSKGVWRSTLNRDLEKVRALDLSHILDYARDQNLTRDITLAMALALAHVRDIELFHYLLEDLSLAHAFDPDETITSDRALALALARIRTHAIIRFLGLDLDTLWNTESFQPVSRFIEDYPKVIEQCFQANVLLLDCLRVATVSDRADIETRSVIFSGRLSKI